MWSGPVRCLGLHLTEHADGNDSQDGTRGESTNCEYLFARAGTEYHFETQILQRIYADSNYT